MDDSLNRVFDTGSAIIGKISDVAYRVPRIDPYTHALETIDYDHHEMHSGSHYFIKTWADINGAATVAYFAFKTPDTTKEVHAKASFVGEDEFRVEIYEDPVLTDQGTAITPRNCNRNYPNGATLAPYAAPTVSNAGTQIWDTIIGAKGVMSVSRETGYEIIAKRNTWYLFKITKTNSGTHWIDINFFWYEHIPKN